MGVRETDDDENDGKHDESHQLDWLATDSVHSCDCDPITRNRASTDNDQIANGRAAEDLVNIVTLSKTNGLQDD